MSVDFWRRGTPWKWCLTVWSSLKVSFRSLTTPSNRQNSFFKKIKTHTKKLKFYLSLMSTLSLLYYSQSWVTCPVVLDFFADILETLLKNRETLRNSRVSALGCREVGFCCDRLGKHYSQLNLPKFWINYANSAAWAYMQAHGKRERTGTEWRDESMNVHRPRWEGGRHEWLRIGLIRNRRIVRYSRNWSV
jgi:hypothetical protein